MSENIQTLMPEVVIEKTKKDYIQQKFQNFVEFIDEWSEKAVTIVVTDENQKDFISQAKEGRLLLKAKRIEVEKVRKSLKEQSLNEGRLIDSIAKYLSGKIEPAERHLELQEKFLEIKERNIRIQLKITRTELLSEYADVIDSSSIQLDLITEEAFSTIINGAKFAHLHKKSEIIRLAQEAAENEKKTEIFQKRIVQVAEYKDFLDSNNDLKINLETTLVDYDLFLADLSGRKIKRNLELAKILKANTKLTKQSEENKKQIEELKSIVKKSAPIIDSNLLQTQFLEVNLVKSNVGINDNSALSEHEILKKKYVIAKTALESVLWFIVPPKLRDVVNQALKEIA